MCSHSLLTDRQTEQPVNHVNTCHMITILHAESFCQFFFFLSLFEIVYTARQASIYRCTLYMCLYVRELECVCVWGGGGVCGRCVCVCCVCVCRKRKCVCVNNVCQCVCVVEYSSETWTYSDTPPSDCGQFFHRHGRSLNL